MTYLASRIQGGGGLPELDVDLAFPANLNVGADYPSIVITGIDGSAGFATALSLTGKFEVCALRFLQMTNENYNIRCTIDGTVIWNDTVTVTNNDATLLGALSSAGNPETPIQVNSTFLLEIQSTTDTSVDLSYLARPIL